MTTATAAVVAWPMTGRDEELRYITSALRRGGGIVLAGAAGVGKTRLAREAAARHGSYSWVTATASARTVPLGAFSSLLGDGDAPRTLHRAAEVLRGARLLVVDDAHLLDEASAALLHQLVLSGDAGVVATLRTGELAPDAVRALWKDERLPRLEVQPLSEPETAELVGTVLGGQVDSGCRDRIWSLTRGNALFLRQLVDGERVSGRLRPRRDVWRWDGGCSVGPELAEIVDARIGAVSGAEREVLEILALGEPLGVTLLEGLADPAALDGVEERGLVAVEISGLRVEARLAHPLYGEVLRGRISRGRARRVRGQLATALGACGSRRAGDTLRRAVLVLDSDLPPDAALFSRATRLAIALFDLPLAERFARAAVQAGAGFDAGLALAYVVSWQGRAADAEPVLDAITELAVDDGKRARLTALRVADTYFALRRPAEAVRLLAAAVTDLDEGSCGELHGIRATLDAHRSRLPEAIATGTAVLASGSAPDGARSWAGFGLCHALGRAGRLAEARAAGEQAAAAAARAGGGPVTSTQLGHAVVTALTLAGELADAQALAAHQWELTRSGTHSAGAMGSLLVGHVAVARGDLPAAVHRLAEARAGVEGRDPGANTLHSGLLLPHALGMLGDGPGARVAQAASEGNRHPGIPMTEPDMVLGRAWVAAAEGVPSEAVRHAREAAGIATRHGQLAVEVLALHTAVCFGDASVADRLTELAAIVEGPRARLAAAHAIALGSGDGVGLDRASQAAEDLGALVPAADAAAHAAAAHEQRGRRGSALASAARARRLAQRCGGASTPALRALAGTEPLTAREREVVTLAASGLANQLIAERLVVSVRTVEGHLYRAFAKLGVSERGALTDVLGCAGGGSAAAWPA